MTTSAPDLSTLSRRTSAPSQAPAAGSAVPRPPSRWKTRVLVPAVVLLSAAGLLLYTARDALAPATPVTVVPVVQRAAETETDVPASSAASAPAAGEVIAQASGWLEPDPFPINVSALAEGVVSEVLVLEGDRVEAGQVVARMVADDARLALAAAEADLAEAAAMVAQAEADLAAAQAQWDNPYERTRAVAMAEAVLAEATADLERHPAEIAVERARLAELEDELERKSRLVDTGAVSRGELARLAQRVEAQRAMLDTHVAMHGIREAKVRQAEADLAAAKEGLRLRIEETRALAAAKSVLERARAAHARAQTARDEAALRLERMEIRAPASGVVMARLAAPGTRLMPGGGDMGLGDELPRGDSPRAGGYAVRLYDPSRLQVRADVPLADAGRLSVGQAAEVTVEALPHTTFRGRVTRLLGEANIQKNTLQVKVAIEDPDPRLRPEMLARVRIFAATPSGNGGAADVAGAASTSGPQRLFVPRSAVVRTGDTAHVWLADRSGGSPTARRTSVQIGRGVVGAVGEGGEGEWVEVAAGVHPGDLIITSDPSALRDGRRIRITQIAGGNH